MKLYVCLFLILVINAISGVSQGWEWWKLAPTLVSMLFVVIFGAIEWKESR